MSSLQTLASNSPNFAVFAHAARLAEADGALAQPLGDDFVQADERAAADEQDVGRVHLNVLLLGMLAAALRRNVGHGAFEHFQQGLLHAFAADIAGDRDVLAGLADLVDFVDVQNTALGRFDVEIGRVQQFQQQVLHVFAHVAGFGQRGGVADGKRHVQNPGQRAGQQRFARAGGAEQQDVRLVDFNVGRLGAERQPLVMAVHRDGQHFLGVLLADHVLVELLNDFARRWECA